MHPIISRILGVSVKSWRAEVADIEKALGRIRTAALPATDHAEAIAAAHAAFFDNPTPETCRVWIRAETEAAGAHAVNQAVHGAITEQRRALIAAKKPAFLQAVEELRAGLKKSAAEIRAHDREQSEAMGEIVESVGPLNAIAKKLDQLDSAIGYFDMDPSSAIGSLSTVIG